MITIHYKSREAHIMQVVEDPTAAAIRLGQLFKGRIQAQAIDEDGYEIGAVWKNDGVLTWYCWVEEHEKMKCRRCQRNYYWPFLPPTHTCPDCGGLLKDT